MLFIQHAPSPPYPFSPKPQENTSKPVCKNTKTNQRTHRLAKKNRLNLWRTKLAAP